MPRLAASTGFALVLLALSLLVVLSPTGPPPLSPAQAQAQGPSKNMGTWSCGGSKCHGDPKPREEYPRLNENTIWMQKDKHSKAYATLTNESLKSGVSPSKIVKNLNIAKAETSDRCLTCHALNATPELRGSRFDIADGVQCEICHGPSQKWLQPHAKKGWTHDQSVKLGMYDTKSLLLRAEKCVSCHLAIEADLVAAGHPNPLTFELDTFTQEMSKPPHWRDKGTWFGARTWAIGQVVALREAAKQLNDRVKANASAPLLQEAADKVVGHGAVVKAMLAVVAPDVQKAVEADVTAAANAVKSGDKAAMTAAAINIVTTVNAQAPKLAGRDLDQATVQKIIQALAGDADTLAAGGVRAAELGAMALDRLFANYTKVAGANKPAGEALDKVFRTVEDPGKYDAKAFATEVRGFQERFK